MLERTFALANVGFADLQSRALLPPGLSMTSSTSRRSLPGDIADFTLTLDTRTLPTGPYSGAVTLRTSDPAHPLYTVQVSGEIQAASGDAYARTVTDRPLDVEVWVPGNRNQGEWITFTQSRSIRRMGRRSTVWASTPPTSVQGRRLTICLATAVTV
jgi:hypothetical protein